MANDAGGEGLTCYAYLTADGDQPPNDGGVWRELCGDTFTAEGPKVLWSRLNPFYLNDHEPSDAQLPERLNFDLHPPLDLLAARDRVIHLAEDEWNVGALIIVPWAVARGDLAYMRALRESSTVGQLRRHERAWIEAACFRDPQLEARNARWAFSDLTDDEPFNATEWFGDEGLISVLPLARLRTAQTAPMCLDPLSRPDAHFGVDYEPAPWWSMDDLGVITSTLEQSGYVTVLDSEYLNEYSAG